MKAKRRKIAAELRNYDSKKNGFPNGRTKRLSTRGEAPELSKKQPERPELDCLLKGAKKKVTRKTGMSETKTSEVPRPTRGKRRKETRKSGRIGAVSDLGI